jgi:sugar-specific transcriptional regulator TrmB
MIEQKLSQLGFGKNDVAVYLSLFEIGKVRAGEVITATNLHRNLVYQSLDKLVERGLVTKTVVSGIAEFVANDPEHLVDEVERKKRVASAVAEELKKMQEESPREIVVYEGLDGIKRATRRNLEADKGETVYVLGASPHESLPELSMDWKQYHDARIKKGILFKGLYGHATDSSVVRAIDDRENTQAKFMPTNIQAPIWFNICGDTSSIFSIDKNPLAINIKSETIADGLKQYVDALWDQQVMTFTGYRAKERSFQDIIDTLKKDEEVLVMGMFEFDPEFATFIEDFHTRRATAGQHGRILLNSKAQGMGERLKKIDKTTIKYMEEGIVTPSVFLLYGNKTLITLPNQRTFLQIDNAEATEAFRVYFEHIWNQETKVLTGAQAVKNIWLESLQTRELKFIGARGYFVDRYPDLFAEIQKEAGRVNGLKWKNVVDASAKDHPLNKIPWMEARYTMKDVKNPNVVWLWGEKVAIANWTEADPVVFVSSNKHLVQSYQDYFDALWGQD